MLDTGGEAVRGHKMGGKAVRVTAVAAGYAASEGATLEAASLRSGAGYLLVNRSGLHLGSLWHHTNGRDRWRVYPAGLPKRFRSYQGSQVLAVFALLKAHADHSKASPAPKSVPADTTEEPTVPLSTLAHINDLIRHVTLVRNACVLLGQRMIERGEPEDGRRLIARGHVHDASKWHGIEWEYLHTGPDVEKDKLALAMKQHQSVNDHHPECWPGGIESMSRLARAEMVCDWLARSQERGTALREWITQTAMSKFGFKHGDEAHREVMEFVDLLLQDPFAKMEG